MKRYFPLVILMFFVVGCSLSPYCDTSEPTSKWHNCWGTDTSIIYTYTGEWKHGRFNGEGTLIYGDGTTFIGTFTDGKPDYFGRK